MPTPPDPDPVPLPAAVPGPVPPPAHGRPSPAPRETIPGLRETIADLLPVVTQLLTEPAGVSADGTSYTAQSLGNAIGYLRYLSNYNAGQCPGTTGYPRSAWNMVRRAVSVMPGATGGAGGGCCFYRAPRLEC